MEGQWVGGDPKALKPGEKIAPGQVVLRVFTPGKMRVVLNLPESQAFWVEPGMKARITPAAAPQRSYVAKCREPEVLPRGTPPTIGFQLTLDAGDVDPRLLPGMRANVTIDAGRVEDALLVPVAAVTAGKVKVRDTDGHVSERCRPGRQVGREPDRDPQGPPGRGRDRPAGEKGMKPTVAVFAALSGLLLLTIASGVTSAERRAGVPPSRPPVPPRRRPCRRSRRRSSAASPTSSRPRTRTAPGAPAARRAASRSTRWSPARTTPSASRPPRSA